MKRYDVYLGLLQQIDRADESIRELERKKQGVRQKINRLNKEVEEENSKFIGRKAICTTDRGKKFEGICTGVKCIEDLKARFFFSSNKKPIKCINFIWGKL